MQRYLFICIFLHSLIATAANEKNFLSEKNWQRLTQINQLIDEGQQQLAIEKLQQFLSEANHKAYDTALAEQTLAYAYRGIDDYKTAILHYQNALSLNALNDTADQDLQFNLAQLYIEIGDYDKGLVYLDRWWKTQTAPPIAAYQLAAGAHYQAQHYKAAIPYLKKFLKLKGGYDKSWHQILMACYLQTKQYQQAAVVLKTMLRVEPNNKEYWLQLVAIWQSADDDKNTLATMELMHSKNLLDNDQLRNLINLYLYLNLPIKAVALIEEQLNNGRLAKNQQNWELLANSWLQAQEYQQAANSLTQAASLSQGGDINYRIAQLYFQLADYSVVIDHLKTALSKGMTKDIANAQLLLGIAYFHQGNYQKAAKSFTLAKQQGLLNQSDNWLQRINDLKDEVN